tara:strand:- start:189 stop:563 length:375 start_codon:yes stop_codon:yes gene_type:complete
MYLYYHTLRHEKPDDARLLGNGFSIANTKTGDYITLIDGIFYFCGGWFFYWEKTPEVVLDNENMFDDFVSVKYGSMPYLDDLLNYTSPYRGELWVIRAKSYEWEDENDNRYIYYELDFTDSVMI